MKSARTVKPAVGGLKLRQCKINGKVSSDRVFQTCSRIIAIILKRYLTSRPLSQDTGEKAYRDSINMPSHTKGGLSTWAISPVAVGFGLPTIKEGGTILFGDAAARAAAGNCVPFVLAAGACEQRTVIAMGLRTLVWVAIAGLVFRRPLRNPV